ncbi:DnaJ domain [Macleaya cordata]|uniref:DnaJ domain n=1 Tax=Macleaya cordata TaxID=56857 RepID=A0A200R313_MACCD|nr:DnaJ domain [Macleaya cordata]OVA17120.1 DnaJ domain [Macleaya cordata]
MPNRNLWISTIAVLRRKLRSSSRFSTNFEPKFESSRVLSCSFYHAGESRVSRSYNNSFLYNYSVSGKHFCSLDGSLGRCWNCGAVAASKLFLACESCKSVQPVHTSVDYFQIYGLEKGFEIEDSNLERTYKDWQKKLHPDLVHSKSEKEKEYAAEQSARVIDAYRTLRKPLSRAIYLLRLEGVHVDEERTVSDPELLAEIMEIREAVEGAANSQALKQIQGQVQEKLESWSKSFGNAFENRKFEDAVTSIQRMTYYNRINEEIVKKL